eukprot:7227226-Ditylum_brightwellii.AAC.1
MKCYMFVNLMLTASYLQNELQRKEALFTLKTTGNAPAVQHYMLLVQHFSVIVGLGLATHRSCLRHG